MEVQQDTIKEEEEEEKCNWKKHIHTYTLTHSHTFSLQFQIIPHIFSIKKAKNLSVLKRENAWEGNGIEIDIKIYQSDSMLLFFFTLLCKPILFRFR